MIYLGNAFFELELEGKAGSSLAAAFSKNPLIEQLQFLPLLFLAEEDTLIVSKKPEDSYLARYPHRPKIALLDDPLPALPVRSWGSSDLIRTWANQKGLPYDMPPLACSKKINSKLWNFQNHSPMELATLVFSENELACAVQNTSNRWVLKTDQGFAGRGHFIFSAQELASASAFAAKEWASGRPLILEPWVDRLLDFSSQWEISKEGAIHLLGLTKCLNTSSGAYLGTEAGTLEKIFGAYAPFAHEHIDYCKLYLGTIAKEGFWGNLGVDAMVYRGQKPTLYPVLEVNARMTMSAAVLLYHKRESKQEITRMYYCQDHSNKTNLLPNGYNRKLIFESS